MCRWKNEWLILFTDADSDGAEKKNKKNDRLENRYDGKRREREKRLFLLRDLETRESVVFIIDQQKKEKKAHVLDIVPGSRLLLMER